MFRPIGNISRSAGPPWGPRREDAQWGLATCPPAPPKPPVAAPKGLLIVMVDVAARVNYFVVVVRVKHRTHPSRKVGESHATTRFGDNRPARP